MSFIQLTFDDIAKYGSVYGEEDKSSALENIQVYPVLNWEIEQIFYIEAFYHVDRLLENLRSFHQSIYWETYKHLSPWVEPRPIIGVFRKT